MVNQVYYAKSLEEDFVSKTIRGKKKVYFQKVESMVKTKTIKPNTKSFGRERRLACTVLSKHYLKTYRPQGIIFQAVTKPDHVYPFDLVLLSDAKKIIVQYYRIKDNLHQYYGHNLIPGFEKFVFKSTEKMLKKFSSPEATWKAVNNFREKTGFGRLPRTKYRLIEYNEIVFHKPVKIRPVALFGYRKNAREIAKRLGLKHYVSAKKFWESLK